MSATSHRLPTKAIVDTIVDKLKALEWTAPDGPKPKAFQRVELFDGEDLAAAFTYLVITEGRVAVVVPLDEEFENRSQGRKYFWTRRLPVMVLVTDRVMGDRKKALWGDTDKNPGAIGLMEIVLPELSGLLVGPGIGGEGKVMCEPKVMSPLTVSVRDTERQLPGRVTMGMEFECRGGWMETTLETGPVL